MGGISPGLAVASPGACCQFLTSFAVALSHTNWGQGSCVASIPPLPSSARELSWFKEFAAKQTVRGWEGGSPEGRGLKLGGTVRSPQGMSGGCKAGVQTHGCPLGAWMKFGWWQRVDQLRTCKLSASLGNPTTQRPAGNKAESSSEDSGCNTLSPSPQTSFETLRRALTLHLPLSPAGSQRCSAREQRSMV